jgi:transposase
MTPNPHRGSDFADFLAEEGLMTPTPRTDAAIAASDGQWSFTLRDLAQELERELAVWKHEAKRLEDQLEAEHETAISLFIELHELKERLR